MLHNMGDSKTAADVHEPYVIGYASIRSVVGLANASDDGALKDAIRAMGIDVRSPRAVYPLETYVAVIRRVAAAFYPDMPEAAALFETGRRDLLFYFSHTLLGRAAFRLVHMAGPRPAVRGLVRFTPTITNLPSARISDVGARQLTFTTHTHVPGDYIRGVLHELVVQAGAQNPEITFSATDPETYTFVLRW